MKTLKLEDLKSYMLKDSIVCAKDSYVETDDFFIDGITNTLKLMPVSLLKEFAQALKNQQNLNSSNNHFEYKTLEIASSLIKTVDPEFQLEYHCPA